jgi:hypothetical protein
MGFRLGAALTAALVSLAAGAAFAQPVTFNIANGVDVILPNGGRMGERYPTFAREVELRGDVMLACTVGTGHALACKVQSETPEGFGFGQAALELAAGATVRGRQPKIVEFPVRFRLPSISTAPPPLGPSASALTIMEAQNAAMHEKLEAALATMPLPAGTQALHPARRAAAEAALAEMKPLVGEVTRRTQARRLDEQNAQPVLARVAAFVQTPAGRELFAALSAPNPAEAHDAALQKLKATPTIYAEAELADGVMRNLARSDPGGVKLSAAVTPELTVRYKAKFCAKVTCHPLDTFNAGTPGWP